MTTPHRARLRSVCHSDDDDFLHLFDLVEAHFAVDSDDAVFREFSLKVSETYHEPERYLLTCTQPISARDDGDFEGSFNSIVRILHQTGAPQVVHEWLVDNFAREPGIIFAHAASRSHKTYKFYLVTPNDQRFLTPFKNELGKKTRHCPAFMGVDWHPDANDITYKEYYQIHIGSTEDLGRFLSDRWIADGASKSDVIDEILRLVDDQWCCASPVIQLKNYRPTQLQVSFKCDCVPNWETHAWGEHRRKIGDIADRFLRIGALCRFDLDRLENWFQTTGEHRLTWMGVGGTHPLAFNLYGEV
jgi:hypothetical protein